MKIINVIRLLRYVDKMVIAIAKGQGITKEKAEKLFMDCIKNNFDLDYLFSGHAEHILDMEENERQFKKNSEEENICLGTN